MQERTDVAQVGHGKLYCSVFFVDRAERGGCDVNEAEKGEREISYPEKRNVKKKLTETAKTQVCDSQI